MNSLKTTLIAAACAALAGCGHSANAASTAMQAPPTAATTMTLAAAGSTAANPDATKEMQPIAEEAFVYGYPMVMNYGTFYEFFVDKAGPQFKKPINQLSNEARVFTPKDTTIVTPNSDTPYSFLGMDLRAEPFVLCNPKIEKSRYFSIQLVDMYTFNYGYIGSRATGNGAACYMIAGPGWKGDTPEGIAKVFHSETDFSMAIIRTQLFNPADIGNVKKIQAGYRAMTLSKFQHKPAPSAAPAIQWPKFDKQMAAENPFTYLNFILQFCPATGPAAVEAPMRARFAKIGVEAGKPFALDTLSPDQRAAVKAGVESGVAKIKQTVPTLGKIENGWAVSTGIFGDRQFMAGDFLRRAAGAMAGIYGNDAAEAMYPLLVTDGEGNKVDTGTHRYVLTFPSGRLPPVNAFWSVTMYDGKTQLLIENPIHRYLINSPMLSGMKKNADGSLTLYIQKDSPGKDRESNWLPAPDGPAYIVMRLYWPKEAALQGTWQPPAIETVK